MRIVILAQYFESTDQPGLTLLSSMADHLARAGHDVTVISGRYTRIGRKKATRFRKMPSGYLVRRTWSGADRQRGSLFGRLLSFLAFSLSSTLALMRLGRCDLIYASSPPIFPIFPALLWGRLSGATFILEICDLWPDSAVALGLIRNKWLIAWTSAMEAFLLRHSDGIVALTNGILERIQTQHKLKAPMIVARCAVSQTGFSQAALTRGAVRRERNWQEKCVAIFAGTMGHAQDIETLLEAAHYVRDHEALRIVIIGDGVYRDRVASAAIELKNVQLLEPLPKTETKNILTASDIGVCTLIDHPLFDGALPTKLIDYLAARLPVVAPDLEEVAAVVTSMKAGLLYRAGDAKSLADALRNLADNTAVIIPHSSLPEEFELEYRNRIIQQFSESLVADRNRGS